MNAWLEQIGRLVIFFSEALESTEGAHEIPSPVLCESLLMNFFDEYLPRASFAGLNCILSTEIMPISLSESNGSLDLLRLVFMQM